MPGGGRNYYRGPMGGPTDEDPSANAPNFGGQVLLNIIGGLHGLLSHAILGAKGVVLPESEWRNKDPFVSAHECASHPSQMLQKYLGLVPTKEARNLGPSLERCGFEKIPCDPSHPVAGDVMVMQRNHACMFDGKHWCSDFVQKSFWPYHGKPDLSQCAYYRNPRLAAEAGSLGLGSPGAADYNTSEASPHDGHDRGKPGHHIHHQHKKQGHQKHLPIRHRHGIEQ